MSRWGSTACTRTTAAVRTPTARPPTVRSIKRARRSVRPIRSSAPFRLGFREPLERTERRHEAVVQRVELRLADLGGDLGLYRREHREAVTDVLDAARCEPDELRTAVHRVY